MGRSILTMVKRLVQYLANYPNQIHTSFIPGVTNPCGCGSNCYHYEREDGVVYGVCNACDVDIYIIKDECTPEIISKGVWKPKGIK